MKPAAASSRRSAAVTESGFASVVTSTSAARPQVRSIAVSMVTRSCGGSSVGVPPPTNTVLTARSGSSAARIASAARAISATALPA